MGKPESWGKERAWEREAKERKNKEKAARGKGAGTGGDYGTEEELAATIIADNLTRNNT